MLSSIHPFGERSRHNRFGVTAGAHIVGSTLGGAALGLLAGIVGTLARLLIPLPTAAWVAVVVVAAAGATVLEATSRERLLPTRTRQVNENWIQQYRGWVYGGGFGAELGFGISTIITTTLVHLLVLTMIVLGDVVTASLLGALFGCVRGATVLTAASVDSADRLRTFHQKLDGFRAHSRKGAVASLALATTVAALGLAGIS